MKLIFLTIILSVFITSAFSENLNEGVDKKKRKVEFSEKVNTDISEVPKKKKPKFLDGLKAKNPEAQNEINHLKTIKQNQSSKVKVLSSQVKKMARQDRIESLATKKFNFHIPSPESLIVYLDN